MKKILSIALIIFLFFAMPAFSAILFYEDFEDALKTDSPADWSLASTGIGSQGLTTDQVRAGSSAYRFSITGTTTPSTYDRQNATVHNGFNNGSLRFTIGNEYWFGFSIFLAEGYHTPTETDGCWGPVHQDFHCTPDVPPTCDPAEPYRHAPFQLEPWDMKWRSVTRSAAAQCNEKGAYDDQDWRYHGSLSGDIGYWTDFVYNFKWSYGGDGFFKIWKNGVVLSSRTGGNCFNDDRGTYVKIGIYGDINASQEMTIYYDELRIGDSSSSYAEVAPGGCTLPTVTAQAVTDITTTTAIGHGTITNTGGENATKRGICWNTTGTPTIADDNITEVGNFSTGAFSGNMTGLTPDQAYFARVFAYNTGGYGYSSTTEGFDTDAEASGTYIIDNGDAETSFTGTWPASGGVNPYGSGSLYCNEVNSTYSFEKTLDGNYTTSMWWTEYSSRSTAVTVKIYDSGDNLLDTKSINQYINGGQWNLLDTYDFNATAKVVILSSGGGPSTCADAVKFDYVEGSGGEDVNNPSCLRGIHLHGCVLN